MQSKTSSEGFRESIKHRQEKAPRPLGLPETRTGLGWAGSSILLEAAPEGEPEVDFGSFSSSPRTRGSSRGIQEHGRG